MSCYDVGVIGGGIVGCSIARRLSEHGCSVILWEKGAIGCEGSGRCAGGVRQSHCPSEELELRMFSQGLWEEMSREVGPELEYQQGGFMKVALDKQEMEEKARAAQWQRNQGLEVLTLTPRETLEIAPFLEVEAESWGATYCPTDGHANPIIASKSVGEAASRAGAHIMEHSEVTGLVRNGSRWQVATGEVNYYCSVLVLAAGPWSVGLAEMVGITLPIEPNIAQIAVTESTDHFMEPFISVGDLGYSRQAMRGNVHIGYYSQPTKSFDRRITLDAITGAATGMPSVIPALQSLSVIRFWGGLTDYTPDKIPILGDVPSVPDFYIAAGFSGTGFELGPGIGVVMAQLITRGMSSPSIDQFHITRFSST